MEKAAENIKTYIEHFREHLSAIRKVKGFEHSAQYRKLLYVAVLDALARCVYPRRSNRERQVDFLTQFSEWKELHKVSLPHLAHLLARTPDPAFAKLRRYVKEQLAKWPHGLSGSPSQDPDVKEVRKHWPSDKEHRFPLEGVQLESLQHVHLFVTYRNSLVHEFRTPGHGYEFPSEEPFYFGKLEGEVNQDSSAVHLLSYPVAFFERITTKCLDNLEKYLHENDIDPYLSYTFGDYWIDELNR